MSKFNPLVEEFALLSDIFDEWNLSYSLSSK